MAYTTIKKPSDYFNTKLYSGNGTAIGSGGNAITGVGFQPDWTWIKARNSADESHYLFDAVRGVTKSIRSNGTGAEGTDAETLTAFASDGFTLGNNGGVNSGSLNYASWNWKANGAGSSNTDGSITSTVSANTTSGFSIVKWTADGSTSGTIGHGLGSTPKIVIYKRLDAASSWYVVYTFVDNSQDYLLLESTAAKADLPSATYGTATSSTISNIGFGNTNSMIAYCFAEVKGFSKFGSYVGNGNADGPFIYTGFKPAFIICKITNTASNWRMFDNKRLGYNVDNNPLYPNVTLVEGTEDNIDILSNGFKWRTTDGALNGSGSSYIYMAFAEEPLVGDNPATAR